MKKGKVVHCKKEPYDVYIGRPSIFGNPFLIGMDGTREQVIEQYRIFIESMVRNNRDLRNQVKNLHGKTLGCWCAPLPCHGDVLLELAERLNK